MNFKPPALAFNPILGRATYKPSCSACLIAIGLWLFAATSFAEDVEQLIELPLDQLVNVEFVSASKYSQRQAEIPASTTIISADQIKNFGHRTLSDVLRSVPGLYISNDGMYDNLGVRGVSGSDQYNGRVLVMIDGYRLNETIYDSGTIGNEFPLDVDLIERVEIVRGPASSIYGSNAFFGVINVITKKGSDFKGGEVAGAYGRFDSFKGRFSYGGKMNSGLEYLVSGSGMKNDGANLYFPEYDTSGINYNRTMSGYSGDSSGHTKNNHADSQQAFVKLGYGDFSLVGGWGNRNQGIPGGPYGTNFNDSRLNYQDTHAFVQGQYQTSIAKDLQFTGRTWFGNYDFYGVQPYEAINNIDTANAKWSGFELRLLSTQFDQQHVTAGIEVQKNWLQRQDNFDENPYASYLHDRHNSTRVGLYLQDDIAITERLNLSLGVRFDDFSLVKQSMYSPKAGITWQALDNTTFKLLYGESFRAPDAWHQFYAYAPIYNQDGTLYSQGQIAAPLLKPESAQTLQGIWEQNLGDNWLLKTSLYHIWMKELFSIVNRYDQLDSLGNPINFQTINGSQQSAYGTEFELEKRWKTGALARASYDLQYAQTEAGNYLFDSPRHLFKLNLMSPLFRPDVHGGLEVLGIGPRHTMVSKVGGYAIANTTLNWQLNSDLDLSASVYNLFDSHYSDPASPSDLTNIKVPNNGRDFRLKLQFRF